MLSVDKENQRLIKDHGDSIGYWGAMCHSFAVNRGLYIRQNASITGTRKEFFSRIYPLNSKWHVDDNDEAQVFRINVSARFRPGEHGGSSFVLPLHQFLQIRRKQQQERDAKKAAHNDQDKDDKASDDSGCLIGAPDPKEFLDPFSGVLLRQPVLLTT